MNRLLIALILVLLCHSLNAQNSSALKYSYWFNNDITANTENSLEPGANSIEIEVSNLTQTTNTIHFQLHDSQGKSSTIHSSPFLYLPLMSNSTIYVFVDSLLNNTLTADLSTGYEYGFDIDCKDLDLGLHTVKAITVSEQGIASNIKEALFFRIPDSEEFNALQCWYTIDYNEAQKHNGSLSGNIMLADIDCNELTDGLHHITFFLGSSKNIVTQTYGAYFFKMPNGGLNIRNYEYWVNDDIKNSVKVNETDASNPYTLTALVSLPHYPLRSSSFHFAIEGDDAVVYPKNDFNILFMDNRNYMTVNSYPYFDTSDPKVITDEIQHVNAGTHIIPSLNKNEIKWFSFLGNKGDSIFLKTNGSCMLDVFDPAADVLFSLEGADVISGKGTHLTKSGNYYIAVHDANNMGSIGTTLEIIDQYAVLDYTPSRFAPDGYLIMEFDGNGYNDLKDILLTGETGLPTDSAGLIAADSLVIYDYGFARAVFNFYDKPDIPTGKYDISLRFDDGNEPFTLTMPQAVTLEEPKIKKIDVKVNPNNQSPADIRTVTVKITNNSNISYTGVPLIIARTSQNPDMGFGFNMYSLPDDCEISDNLYFDTEHLFDKDIKGRYTPIYLPYIGPGETITYPFYFERKPGNNFNLYAWCDIPLSEEIRNLKSSPRYLPSIKRALDYNGMSHFMDCASIVPGASMPASVLNIHLNLGATIGGIQLGLGHQVRQAERQALGGGYALIEDAMPQYRIPTGMTPRALMMNSFNPSNAVSAANCLQNSGQSDCENPHPEQEPTNVDFPESFDPNDLYGYLSNAGSEYIGKDVSTLQYTVLFENDPEFATASAMTVKIEDVLDPKTFDATSFKPQSLTIGNKTATFNPDLKNQTITMDMRPSINSIAEATVSFNEITGQATLVIRSLNPHTMDQSDDISQGFLPVNFDGRGEGQFIFTIDINESVGHGESVDNVASIIFDSNDAMTTPVWHNITDFETPTSSIVSVSEKSNITYTLTLSGSDNDSGIWHFDVYYRDENQLSWKKIASEIDGEEYIYFSDIELENPEFRSIAIDRAGNKEKSGVYLYLLGDLDSNGSIDAVDVVLLYNYYTDNSTKIDRSVADLNNDGIIDSQDAVAIQQLYVNTGMKQQRTRMPKQNFNIN